jgi:hypothetical protein
MGVNIEEKKSIQINTEKNMEVKRKEIIRVTSTIRLESECSYNNHVIEA